MLRITDCNNDGVMTFKLEGRLSGEWVKELRRCWEQARLLGTGCSIRIDLSGVSWVSDEGKSLLGVMHHHGAELLATNLLTAGIVAELCADSTTHHPPARRERAPVD